MAKQIFITFVFFVSVFYHTNGQDAALPSYITPCSLKDPNFNECVKNEIIKAIPNFKHGVESLGIPSLDPLLLTKNIDLKQNGLDLTFKDVTIYGLGDAKIQNVQCGAIAAEPPLKVVYDKTKRYPDCCGKIVDGRARAA